MRKFVSFLQTHKSTINFYLPIVIAVVFLFAFIPNLTRIPGVSSILSHAVIWRSIGAIIGTLYFAVSFIANGCKFDRKVLIAAGFFAFLTILSALININQKVVSSYTDQYAKIITTVTTFGAVDILTFIFNNIWCALFLFYMFGVYPYVDKTEKIKYLPYMILILLVSINVLVCLITEYKTLIETFKGNFTFQGSEGLHALFPSKNAFGMFLFQGGVLAYYLFKKTSRWWILIFTGVFGVFIVLSLCKSAMLGYAVFFLCLIIGSIINFKAHKTRNIVLSVCLGLCVVFFILFVSVPALHDSGVLKKVYDFLFNSNPDNRSGVAITVLKNMEPGYYFCGYAHSFLYYLNAWCKASGGWVVDLWSPHNSYVSLIGYRGVFALLGYLAIVGYVAYIFVKKQKNYTMMVFLLSALISVLAYGFFEDDVIFISTSANTLLLTVMFAEEYKECALLEQKEEVYEW